MNDILLFVSCSILTVVFCRLKRFMLGDFIVIQRKSQPVLFWHAVIVFFLFAFDGFCNTLTLFMPGYIAIEKMKFLDDVIRFFGCFVFSIACFFVKNITIKKKKFTWKENSLIRFFILVVFLSFSVYFLKRITSFLFGGV